MIKVSDKESTINITHKGQNIIVPLKIKTMERSPTIKAY